MTSSNKDKEKLQLEHEQLVEKARQKEEALKLKVAKDTSQNKQSKNYNAVLDSEQHHCTVDFLQFVDEFSVFGGVETQDYFEQYEQSGQYSDTLTEEEYLEYLADIANAPTGWEKFNGQ